MKRARPNRVPGATITVRAAAAEAPESAPVAPEATAATDGAAPIDAVTGNDDSSDADQPRRGGWWQRTFGA